MPAQSPLNVVLPVREGAEAALRSLLMEMAADPAGNAVLPFGRTDGVHFARVVLLPRANRRVGRHFPPRIVIAANVDGDCRTHLTALVRASGPGLGRLLCHCPDSPPSSDEAAVVAYLESHRAPVGGFYVNTIGRTVARVAFEADLVRALQERLDAEDWSGHSPAQVRAALIEFVASREDLEEALRAPDEPGRVERVAGYAILAVVALVAVVLALALLPLLLIGVVLLRLHEVANAPANWLPRDERVRALEQDEDHGVQNQLSAVGVLQRSPLRYLLLRIGLFGLQLASRYYFNRGKLAEIDTIHFARWVIIDGGARLYFFSNYDGSAESYQDDFIERVAFGLNLVFSNGAGWPRTRYLILGGAGDEQAFKAYYRDRQIPTQVWYTAPAYRGLTAVNVANHSAIRRGLRGPLSAAEVRRWLQRF